MGKIGVDTSLFIYLIEKDVAFLAKAEKILKEIESGKVEGVFSIIGLMELLVGPKKKGRKDIAIQYKKIITEFANLKIAGINENIVDLASDLRAKYSLRLPDCIHLATAIDSGADKFITNDKTLKKVKEIKIETL